MDTSDDPVAFTHSNVKYIYDHPRNLAEDQIKKCSSLGGVIGLNGHPAFVKSGTAMPKLEDFVFHIEKMIELAGIDHVGLGLDFSHPPGVQMPSERYQKLISQGIFTRETLPSPP